LAALLLVIGIICFGVNMGWLADDCNKENEFNATTTTVNPHNATTTTVKLPLNPHKGDCDLEEKVQNYWTASIVFACFTLLAAVAGALAPLVCNTSEINFCTVPSAE